VTEHVESGQRDCTLEGVAGHRWQRLGRLRLGARQYGKVDVGVLDTKRPVDDLLSEEDHELVGANREPKARRSGIHAVEIFAVDIVDYGGGGIWG
jgi:hypothetical protein